MSVRERAVDPKGPQAADGSASAPSLGMPGADVRVADVQVADVQVSADGASQHLSIDLPMSPRSVGVARAAVVDFLRRFGRDDAVDVASLLTSELVTNAVLHGRSAIGVSARLTSDRLRVEAYDESDRLPVRRRLFADATDGRGLVIVASLATDWGHEHRGRGKAVWFELAL